MRRRRSAFGLVCAGLTALTLAMSSLAGAAATAAGSVHPEQWHLWAFRSAPWDRGSPTAIDAIVPYLPGPAPPPSGPVAALVIPGKAGGSIRVAREPTDAGVRLSIVGPVSPGTYQDKVTLSPGSEIDLTVQVTDSVLWPVVALGLGVLLALAVQQEVGVLRRVVPVQRRAEEHRARFLRALEAARTRSPHRNRALDALKTDWLRGHGRVVDTLRALSRSALTLDAKDPDYVGALKELERLDAVTDGLPELTKLLDELGEKLHALELGVPVTAGPLGLDADGAAIHIFQPAFINEARHTYVDQLELRVQGFGDTLEAIRRCIAMTESWPKFVDEMRRRQALVRTIGSFESEMNDADLKTLQEARQLVELVRWQLWHATDPEDLRKRGYAERWNDLDLAVGRLSGWISRVPPREFEVPREAAFALFQPAVSAWRVLGVRPPTELERAIVSAGVLRAREAAGYTLVSFVVLAALLFAGLQALYVGRPFGTPIDYLAALFWGSSAKIGFDVGSSALASFRVPFRST